MFINDEQLYMEREGNHKREMSIIINGKGSFVECRSDTTRSEYDN